jgi:hypothetical protein
MKSASELVLGDGRTCGVDVHSVAYPDRYSDKRGQDMWERVMRLIQAVEERQREQAEAA